MDGVLAKFESGFAPILSGVSGITFPVEAPEFPPVWDWPTHYGATAADVQAAWDQVKASPTFWSSLRGMPDADRAVKYLNYLQRMRSHDVYFLTHRMGTRAKQQTEIWLMNRGMDTPTVMLVQQKYLAAVALRLDVYIDDRFENVDDVKAFTADSFVDTRDYMPLTPYNQRHAQTAERLGIEVVPDLISMLRREFAAEGL